MPNSDSEHRVLSNFTSGQWSGHPGQGCVSLFVGFAFMGAVLCFILMAFLPGLSNAGALLLFSTFFAIVLTTLVIAGAASAERKFLNELAATVNDTILGLTGNANDRLSTDQFRALIENGKPLPLLVNGVPGLELQVFRPHQPLPGRAPSVKPADNVDWTTRIVISVTPPDYGITSFDRLLAAFD